jgi:hypothetical protein
MSEKRVKVKVHFVFTLALVATGALGCAGGGEMTPGPGDPNAPMVAFAASFKNFRSWPATQVTSDVSVAGSIHLTGPRTVYLNRPPPPGATEYPVGTIFAKTLGGSPRGEIFAMVKRGAGYNAAGAVGWEWFELRDAAAGEVVIVWRGIGPNAGACPYGNIDASCNTCHMAARNNDFVLGNEFQLSPAGRVEADASPPTD